MFWGKRRFIFTYANPSKVSWTTCVILGVFKYLWNVSVRKENDQR